MNLHCHSTFSKYSKYFLKFKLSDCEMADYDERFYDW